MNLLALSPVEIALVWTALAAAALASYAQGRRAFTGTISDAMCASAGHAAMRMGPTDAECTVACVEEHDAAYVLVDGKDVYQLSDQKTPARFAARRVTVTGTLDARTGTIHVASIAAAK